MTAATVVYCDPDRAEDLSAQQRAAVVTSWLQAGRELTSADVQRALGLQTQSAAWTLLNQLAGVLPIVRDDGGLWRWVGADDGN